MTIYRIDLAVIAVSVLGLWLLSRRKYGSRNVEGLPFPPGPKGLPLIGNVRDMPLGEGKEWLALAEWGKKYGT